MDIKSFVIWGSIGLLSGGGLYGLYINTYGKAAYSQSLAYGQIGECISLQNSKNKKRIYKFINESSKSWESTRKSDAVVIGTNMALGNNKYRGMGKPLSMCVKKLTKHVLSL